MLKLIVVAVSCVAISLCGCTVSTDPKSVSRLDQKTPISIMRAEWSGKYTLYRIPEGGKTEWEEIQAVHLKKGEELGFRSRESGIVAVAGGLEVPVSNGVYEWIMIPYSGQVDPLATGIFVAVSAIVVVAVVVGVAILFAALAGPALLDWH